MNSRLLSLFEGISIDLPAPLTTPFHRKRDFAIINPGPAVTDKRTLTDTSGHRKPQRFVDVYQQLHGLLGEEAGFPV